MNKEFINKALERDEDTIRDMFEQAAPHYDFLNHALSFNLDNIWRKTLVDRSNFETYGNDLRVLDLCTGTGDLLFEFARRKTFSGKVFGMDFARSMLEVAQIKAKKMGLSNRVEFIESNVNELPFETESIHIVTIAFGLRNLQNMDTVLSEIRRVLKPDGKFLSLEFFRSDGRMENPLARLYVSRIIPLIGKIVTKKRGAYDYLPMSRDKFITAKEFDDKLKGAGFVDVSHGHFLFRVTTLHSCVKR